MRRATAWNVLGCLGAGLAWSACLDLTPLGNGNGSVPADSGATADATTNGSVDAGNVVSEGGPPTSAARDLAIVQQRPATIVVDDTTVYWINFPSGGNSGAIMKVAKRADAGAPEIAVANVARQAMCADSLSLFFPFWVNNGGWYVARREKTGTNTVPLLGPGDWALRCTVQGGRVYGIRMDNGGIASSSTDSAGSFAVPDITGATALAVDATDIYAATAGKILRVSKEGGSPIVFANTSGPVSTIAHDATTLFWTEVTSVRSLAKAAPGATPTDLAKAQDGPSGIALDDTNVYFTTLGDGTVQSVPKGGSAPGQTPTVLSTGEGGPWGIAADAVGVYWTNRDDGRVRVIWR